MWLRTSESRSPSGQTVFPFHKYKYCTFSFNAPIYLFLLNKINNFNSSRAALNTHLYINPPLTLTPIDRNPQKRSNSQHQHQHRHVIQLPHFCCTPRSCLPVATDVRLWLLQPAIPKNHPPTRLQKAAEPAFHQTSRHCKPTGDKSAACAIGWWWWWWWCSEHQPITFNIWQVPGWLSQVRAVRGCARRAGACRGRRSGCEHVLSSDRRAAGAWSGCLPLHHSQDQASQSQHRHSTYNSSSHQLREDPSTKFYMSTSFLTINYITLNSLQLAPRF